MPTASSTSSDVAEEIGKAQGGFYDESTVVANNGKKWLGVPWCVVGAVIVYRKSWFAGSRLQQVSRRPGTSTATLGKKLKAKGHPLGQTLGHTFGDAPTFWYPFLWSWGGKEVEEDGKTVVLNSKATRRVGQVRGRLLEGLLRRRRARLGRLQQQPRLPLRHDQRHA